MQPVRSIRHSTRAAQLPNARTYFDRLAGRLGTHLLTAFIDAGWIIGISGQRWKVGQSWTLRSITTL
jgi:hypothetical protein